MLFDSTIVVSRFHVNAFVGVFVALGRERGACAWGEGGRVDCMHVWRCVMCAKCEVRWYLLFRLGVCPLPPPITALACLRMSIIFYLVVFIIMEL